ADDALVPGTVTAPRRDLEPDGLALVGGPGTPPAGELVDEVEPTAPLVVLARAADAGQPEILVEHLDPDGLAAAPQAQRELLLGDDLLFQRDVPGVLEGQRGPFHEEVPARHARAR